MPQHLPPAQPAPDDPSDVSDTIVLRTPQLRDAGAMWRLAVASGALEANSAYAYLLCCAHFAGTSLVAVDGSDRADKPVDGDGFVGGEGSDALQQATTAGREPDGPRLLGMVYGYRPPQRSDVLFVWQVGVAEAARRRGLGRRMLCHLLQRLEREGVRYLEATVDAQNVASQRLFQAVAEAYDVPLHIQPGFVSADFDGAGHPAEPIIRIGPLKSNRAAVGGSTLST